MYRMQDRKAAIREIQKYLYELALSGEYPIPHRLPDGIYEEETAAGVRVFQERCGLPVTGVVDRITFEKLYAAYSSLKRREGSALDREAFPLKEGCSCAEAEELNAMLCELAGSYRDIQLFHGEIYSAQTAANVRKIQRHFGQDETGETDEELFLRIRLEVRARKETERLKKLTESDPSGLK